MALSSLSHSTGLFLCCFYAHCPGGPMSLDAPFPVGGGELDLSVWADGLYLHERLGSEFYFQQNIVPWYKNQG